MQYRRSYLPGGTFFFTVNLYDRRSDLLVTHISLLRAVIKEVKRKHPFIIDAAVIMPDHLHMIWVLPAGDQDYSIRWGLIKRTFSRRIKSSHGQVSPIWQNRFWEHQIRSDKDYENHLNYIHFNPVKHGQVNLACLWPHSSIHKYIRQGVIPMDWAGTIDDDPSISYGEVSVE